MEEVLSFCCRHMKCHSASAHCRRGEGSSLSSMGTVWDRFSSRHFILEPFITTFVSESWLWRWKLCSQSLCTFVTMLCNGGTAAGKLCLAVVQLTSVTVFHRILFFAKSFVESFIGKSWDLHWSHMASLAVLFPTALFWLVRLRVILG